MGQGNKRIMDFDGLDKIFKKVSNKIKEMYHTQHNLKFTYKPKWPMLHFSPSF